MQNLKIVKIGGKIIDSDQELHQTLETFAAISAPKILVHGGGSSASVFSEKLGIIPKLINGRRITHSESLKIVQMVYAGLINKNIVAKLQALNCQAIGLSGADANTIRAMKRPVKEIDYGYVGDISEVNSETISKLLQNGFIPVFCALTHDGYGQMLNTNADTIAAELAGALSNLYQTELIYCFENEGVLTNMNDSSSVIPIITPDIYEQLKSNKAITDGMFPKIDNAFQSLQKGVQNVYISHFSALSKLNSGDRISGTRITLDAK